MGTVCRFLGFLVLGLMLIGAPPLAHGRGMQNGLAVATTRDLSRLVAGGSNRVLYELDPMSLAVKRRVFLGRRIMQMAFSADGAVLVVESTKAVQFLKADTLRPFETLKKAERITPVPALDAIAVQDRGREPAIRILGFADAQEIARIPYDSTQSIAAFGVSPDGKNLALLYVRRKDENETKVSRKDIPPEIKKHRNAALREYQQRHDGNTALFQVFDIASGQVRLKRRLWYAAPSSNTMLVWRGDDVYVVGYDNQDAKISKEGEVTYFELENGFNYAFAATDDGAAFWTGGLRRGARTTVESLEATPFSVDALPGFPEYYKSFSIANDGTAFAGTTAFRVARLSPEGKLIKVAPVY